METGHGQGGGHHAEPTGLSREEVLRRIEDAGGPARVVLAGENLERSNLRGIDLRGANLRGANLSGAILDHAKLNGADLQKANLARAHMTAADMSGAMLSGANLADAYLYMANLRRANLSMYDFKGERLLGTDGRPIGPADLNGANLTTTNLEGTNLVGVNYKLATMTVGHDWNAITQLRDLKDSRVGRFLDYIETKLRSRLKG